MKKPGKQQKRFKFFLNPYQDMRCTRCPKCEGKTRQKKLPLVIHVEPRNLMVLNKTCRYCPYCDLLIAHQDELEPLLAAYFAKHNPEVVGHEYLVVGTVERSDWKQGIEAPMTPLEMLERMYDFKEVLQFKPTGGWGPAKEARRGAG